MGRNLKTPNEIPRSRPKVVIEIEKKEEFGELVGWAGSSVSRPPFPRRLYEKPILRYCAALASAYSSCPRGAMLSYRKGEIAAKMGLQKFGCGRGGRLYRRIVKNCSC